MTYDPNESKRPELTEDEIVAAAKHLPLLTPSHDLWEGIESRIEAPIVQLPVAAAGIARDAEIVTEFVPATATTRRRWTRWNVAAAATILVAATAGVTWTVAQRGGASTAGLAASDTLPADTGFAAAMAFTQNARNVSRPAVNQTYEGEISALRTIVDQRSTELDSTTRAVLTKNLKVIDDAIAESKAALAGNPASAFLLDRLTDAYDSKLRTLRTIAAMPPRG